MKILLVDDSQSATKMMSMYLNAQPENYDIAVADSGFQALDSFTKFKPDLTVLDITMPNMDGIETLTRIFQIDKNANVIMATAMDSQQKIETCLRKGARGYITKPYSPDELVTLIKNVLKGDTTTKDLITFFSRVASKMNDNIRKIVGSDVSILLEDVKITHHHSKTFTPELVPSIKSVPEIQKEIKIDLPTGCAGFTTEIEGQIDGTIVSAINEEDLHDLLSGKEDEKRMGVQDDMFLEFFNVININLLSQLADSMNVKLESPPTRPYIKDKDSKAEGKDLIQAKFAISWKERTITMEIYLYINRTALFKTL